MKVLTLILCLQSSKAFLLTDINDDTDIDNTLLSQFTLGSEAQTAAHEKHKAGQGKGDMICYFSHGTGQTLRKWPRFTIMPLKCVVDF